MDENLTEPEPVPESSENPLHAPRARDKIYRDECNADEVDVNGRHNEARAIRASTLRYISPSMGGVVRNDGEHWSRDRPWSTSSAFQEKVRLAAEGA